MLDHPLTALVTLFAVAVTFGLGLNVGRARVKHQVAPPATEGPPAFQRINRAHQNTLEFLPLYLPALWLAAFGLGDVVAAGIGVFWPLGRIWYAVGYYADAGKRFPGFLVSALSLMALWLAALGAVVGSLVAYTTPDKF